MNSIDRTTLERLRHRAAQCRRLAGQAYSTGIAAELQTLAQDYDDNAAELEMAGVDRRAITARSRPWA